MSHPLSIKVYKASKSTPLSEVECFATLSTADFYFGFPAREVLNLELLPKIEELEITGTQLTQLEEELARIQVFWKQRDLSDDDRYCLNEMIARLRGQVDLARREKATLVIK